MWPFNRNKRQRKFIRDAFDKYVDHNVIDNMLSDSLTLNSQPEIKHIGFILILVKEEQSITFRNTVTKVLGIVQEHNVMIECITGTFISVLVGVPLELPDTGKVRHNILDKLSNQLGAHLAILHGECDCAVEIVGNEKRFSYTAILPDYKSKLRRLASLDYGKIEEAR